jgi:serine protease Do
MRDPRPFRVTRLSTLLFLLLQLNAPLAWAQDDGHIWTELDEPEPDPDTPLTISTFSVLAEQLSPAVVTIMVTTLGRVGPWEVPAAGEGSGVIISSDGYILTNHHVVEGAQQILVTLHDNREFQAQVVGSDAETDVALIHIDARDLPVAPLGDSERLRVGDWVLAIGNPFDLSFTVTAGIVSALGRRNIHPDERAVYEDFIQTDASINPGNSGGPLINVRGEVIGINTVINAVGQGIGFAIPINMIKVLIPQLLHTGTVQRSCIGVRIQPLTSELAQSYGLDQPQGALVREVNPGGPAEEAGIQPGDIILEFNDETIEESEELPWLASIAGVGNEVEMEVLHEGGDRDDVTITMGELPCLGASAVASTTTTPSTTTSVSMGIHVSDIPADLRRDLGIPDGVGVIVDELEIGSPAQGSGLRIGDIVTQVDSTPVSDPSQFQELLNAHGREGILRLRIRRGSSWVFIAFTLP